MITISITRGQWVTQSDRIFACFLELIHDRRQADDTENNSPPFLISLSTPCFVGGPRGEGNWEGINLRGFEFFFTLATHVVLFDRWNGDSSFSTKKILGPHRASGSWAEFRVQTLHDKRVGLLQHVSSNPRNRNHCRVRICKIPPPPHVTLAPP
jgi:hypothetical protein